MASFSVHSLMKDEEPRNWADLPSELTSSILLRLGAIEILENAQKVCTSWRRLSKDPSMWRKIEMHHYHRDWEILKYDLEIMCRHAVDRGQGGLVEIDIWHFGTDNILNYIADRSSNLRSLRLAMCSHITDEGIGKSLSVVGQSCPNLKTLKLNLRFVFDYFNSECDNNAIAIAESMPELRHLQIIGNRLNDTGLNAILDGSPHLEHLDLCQCFNIDLVGDLEKRCSERIRVLRRPYDSDDDSDFIYDSADRDLDYYFSRC